MLIVYLYTNKSDYHIQDSLYCGSDLFQTYCFCNFDAIQCNTTIPNFCMIYVKSEVMHVKIVEIDHTTG